MPSRCSLCFGVLNRLRMDITCHSYRPISIRQSSSDHGKRMDGRNRRVVVTGIGLVTPLGIDKDVVFGRLLAGECGVTALTGLEYSKMPSRVAALVTGLDLESHFSTGELKKMTRSIALALVASDMALSDAGWKPTAAEERERTGVAVGMSLSPLSDVVEAGVALGASGDGYKKVSPFFVVRRTTNMAAGHIAMRHGFHGPNHAVSTACATGSHSIGDAFRFVRNGDADVMVCGGSDAPIEPLVVAGFARMRALCTTFNSEPNRASRPFDRYREGFVLGEGSGIMVLEEFEHAQRRGAPMYAEILGYGLSGDGHHISAPHPDGFGAYLSMRAALRDAGVDPLNVGYINAHATSTPLGDAAEVAAIKRLFGAASANLAVSSTKGATGHLQGAAGSVEAIFTVLACGRGTVPPTINLEEPDVGLDLNFVPKVAQPFPKCDGARNFALTNSFGFGGTNATLCFGSI